MKNIIYIILIFPLFVFAQVQDKDSVKVDLSSPHAIIYTHLYFLQSDSFQPKKAAKTIYGLSESKAEKKAIKIKQVLDGKGLYVDLDRVPTNPNYKDSIGYSSYYKYVLFPQRMPQIYVEKVDDKWYYSSETIAKIDDIYKEVFPWYVQQIQEIIPVSGHKKFFGIEIWQFIALVLLFVFPSAVEKADLTLFVYWFGALSLANLPTNVTFWIQQAKSRFDLILINRLIQLAPYTFMLAYIFFSEYAISIHEIALIHLSTNALGGFIAVVFGWSGIKNLSKFNTLWINKIYQFGRYPVGSVIGTNLLKSSDTIIIKYFLGSASLAVYSIANKVIEILEIPIRSFVATVLPKMAKSHANKEGSNVIADLYTKNVGLLSVALIPVLIGIFIFAEFVVVLIGGAEYQDAALILRIFVVYGFFLTVDRFTGITLDAINQPQHNFIKMIAMVTANVVLDLIAVYTLGTLWSISVVTIITILTGVIVGNSFLKKKIDIQYGKILGEGTHFWKSLILKQIKKS